MNNLKNYFKSVCILELIIFFKDQSKYSKILKKVKLSFGHVFSENKSCDRYI